MGFNQGKDIVFGLILEIELCHLTMKTDPVLKVSDYFFPLYFAALFTNVTPQLLLAYN